jgi:tRNA A-37 threonylcarbamoyl transferase component Bud32
VALNPADFTGTDRFVVQRCLGSGGFGTVYLTYDRLRHADVALKILRHADPASLLALKREFRALADLSHPNLVSLYELLTEQDQWFITMEHINGNEFVIYVNDTARSADEETANTADRVTGAEVMIVPRPLRPALTAANLQRLDAALNELATGLAYLHAQGRVHRDIKPSNVLVTAEGRVVLLDFGLVTDLESQLPVDERDVRGTPAYMAPLRERGAPFTTADDWYSVGVMLFEILTGTLPFTGAMFEVLQAKSTRDAPAPNTLVPSVPDELDRLCRALLSRDPQQRLDAAATLMRDGRGRSTSAPGAAVWPSTVPLVGRDTHLEALDRAYLESRDGQAVTVFVHGSSGIGKTALVRSFLRRLPNRLGPAIVLSGRCFERESVPYKALDSVVDALSDYLCTLPTAQVEAMLPRDILALARVFPVLRRVEGVVNAKHRVLEIPDALELRRRAFAAFRELMARLTDHHPVVVFIDDLQWGDEDSAALLAELLRPPQAPPLLVIATYRSEEASSSAALRRLLPNDDTAGTAASVRQIAVSGLTPQQSRELTAAIQSRGAAGPMLDDAVLREAAGNPFLISELARHVHPHDTPGVPLSLDNVILERVTALPAPARRLLEVLAVFGQPLNRELASRAAAIEFGAMDAVSLLRAQHLSRTRVMDDREELETYHDRIRETVVAHLPSEQLRAHHRALADTLVAVDNPDPEILTVHYQGAGDHSRAAGYAVIAAEHAADKLAFDRAARLYRMALELDPAMPHERRGAIQVHLGDALASAGRGGEAADAYLAAAAHVDPRQQLELRRRAAEQQLRSGQIDAGFDTIRDVLAAIGMSLASSPQRALISMLWQRVKIRLRGIDFVERRAEDVSPDDLIRIDACWSVAMGLGIVDSIRGADFQGRHLLLALDAGEPYRVSRALSFEVSYGAIAPGGRKAEERLQRIARLTHALAERINHPQALGLIHLTRGVSAALKGEYRAALQLCDTAEQIFDERCTGVGWELATAHLYSLLALFYLGELTTMSRRLPLLLQEARERDDLNAVANFRTRLSYLARLAADDVPGAKEEVRRGIAVWSRKGFTAQHFFELQALVDIAVYEEAGGDAWAAVERSWRALHKSLLLRVQRIRMESLSFRMRAAIAAAQTDPIRRAELLRDADRTAKQLRKVDSPQAEPMALIGSAAIDAMAGRSAQAIRALQDAVVKFEATGMPLHWASARRRLGEALGDGSVDGSDQWLREHGVLNPAAWARMLVPGDFARH